MCIRDREMRELLTTALDKAEREEQKDRIRVMIICFDFLGLSSSYDRMYTNGDAASRALYEQRYTDMYNEMCIRDRRYGICPFLPRGGYAVSGSRGR